MKAFLPGIVARGTGQLRSVRAADRLFLANKPDRFSFRCERFTLLDQQSPLQRDFIVGQDFAGRDQVKYRRTAVPHHFLKLGLLKQPVLENGDFTQHTLVSFMPCRLQIVALEFLKQRIPVGSHRQMNLQHAFQNHPALIQLQWTWQAKYSWITMRMEMPESTDAWNRYKPL